MLMQTYLATDLVICHNLLLLQQDRDNLAASERQKNIL